LGEVSPLVLAGIVLVIIGVLLVFVGVLHSILAPGKAGGRVEAGGAVIIGPFPLIFGTSSKAALAASIIALVILVVLVALMLLSRKLLP
jgi:uncharacterized protein (TIGR00304 family)